MVTRSPLLLLATAMIALVAASGAAEKRPNIVFLFADDQRTDTIGAHGGPNTKHPLLFDLHSDPHEQNNLAEEPAHQAESERLVALMEGWRTTLGDQSPLRVEEPEPKEPSYDNSKRTLDVWQTKWIRDKYFGGRNNTNHGPKKP